MSYCFHAGLMDLAIWSQLFDSAFNRSQSSGRYSVESWQVHVYLTFKSSPERNCPGLLILLQQVLIQGSHLLKNLIESTVQRVDNGIH